MSRYIVSMQDVVRIFTPICDSLNRIESPFSETVSKLQQCINLTFTHQIALFTSIGYFKIHFSSLLYRFL